MDNAPFLPVTSEEMQQLGWEECDVILITGDAYVDHPSFGTALIGRHLQSLGYRVGIIPQPNVESPDDFLRLGRPRLFVGITSGAMDSMVNHYTSLGRLRSDDSYSEDAVPGKRPDRALLRYVNLVQRTMPGVPTVIGGIEASMRRVSHYDFWSDKVRKSILLDSKATVLVYGMGERAAAEIAESFAEGRQPRGVRGSAVFLSEKAFGELDSADCVELPSHETILEDPAALMELTKIVERESNPFNAKTLIQRADSRVVIIYPPSMPLNTGEMDRLYELPFARKPHPIYMGRIPAFEMIKDSVTVVRGCSGGCSFCALGLHQGRQISSRSPESVEREVGILAGSDDFRGTVTDLGGPTANLYGLGCSGGPHLSECRRNSCLYPEICPYFITDHGPYIDLLNRVSRVPGVFNVFVSSGIRYDVALRDPDFVRQLASKYVPGYLKIAPEHFSNRILRLMRKPSADLWRDFLRLFREESSRAGKQQYVVPYIMAAFPGCSMEDMRQTAGELMTQNIRPEKAQVFLPTPMTMATAIYYSGKDPETGEELRVAWKPSEKRRQLGALPGHTASPSRSGKNSN